MQSISLDLARLNPSQYEAVTHVDGPTLVLAGAGSGKTRVLTHKIAYLVSRGVNPWRILAVTFTNKAAREMNERVEALLSQPVQGLWIGTFHAICARILRMEAGRWGHPRDFTIYDRDDQIAVVKKAMREKGVSAEWLKPSDIHGRISRAKNDFTSPEELEERIAGPEAPAVSRVYRRYQQLLVQAGAFDFDDLLLRPVEKFRSDKEALSRWQQRFRHILVDEYQDTNRTQYFLVTLLAGGNPNVTVVGDDDQSIYSWRGADIRNILDFEHDFPTVKTVRLEQNYRSTGTVLDAANAVIANNLGRKAKSLWTEGDKGDAVTVLPCWSDRNEAERVITSIENDLRERAMQYRDIVILYRTNSQSRAFEDILRSKSIPYTIVGGLRFYERREIKDVLAYLRLLANHNDTVSFERAVGVPKRGIGPKTVQLVVEHAREKGRSLMEQLEHIADIYKSGKTRETLREFHSLMADLAAIRETNSLGDIIRRLLERVDFDSELDKDPESADTRRENIAELVTALDEYEPPEGEDPLASFLSEVTLVTDIDSWDGETGAVTLMTLHAAKGLEFPSVYLVGVEDGLFPLRRAEEDDTQLEEERRLMYVGMTRAQRRLTISYAQDRFRFGAFSGGPSRFVEELPEDCVVVDEQAPQTEWGTAPKAGAPVRKEMAFEDYSQEVPEDAANPFPVGMFVRHPTFGRGKITACSGRGEDIMLTIAFGKQVKKIMPKFARLTPA